MKLLIFGASGATGRHLVAQALRCGHEVTAFVRDKRRLQLTHKKLSTFEGNVANLQAIEQAMRGQEVVLSALGANKVFRFDAIVVQGLANIVEAMYAQGVQRLVYLSTLGVPATRRHAGFIIRALAPTILNHEIKGHELREKIICASRLQWTIIRAPILTNGAITNNYRSGEHLVSDSFATRMSRADVASCMLSQLNNRGSARKALSLMTAPD